MNRIAFFNLLCATLLAACGADPAASNAETASATGTAGDEGVVDPVPEGPPRTYIAPHHDIVLGLDLERVRASAVSDDIASLVRSYPTWRDLLADSGIDPVRDFDRVLLGATGALDGRAVMVLRHHLTEARVREAVLNVAVSRGTRPQWRTVEGFAVVEWPAEVEPPRLLVLTGEHELVLTAEEGLDEVIATARDHRARRQADESIDPGLQFPEGTIATVTSSELSESIRRRLPIPPPSSFELQLRDDTEGEEESQMVLSARAGFASDADADQAGTYLREQRDAYAGQMLVRAVGLDGALRRVEITSEASTLDVVARFTEEEVQRVLGLLALGQQLGGS